MNTSAVKGSAEPKQLTPLQITQINPESMVLEGTILSSDPVEPMVAAEIQENASGRFINIRIVVFVPRTLIGKEPITLWQVLGTEKNELKLIVQCNNTELTAPSYYSWYVNYLHPIAEGDPEIDTIITHTKNMFPDDANPKTSRGTITRALQS